ncbi:MAG: hypothetical protein P8P30_04370 [Rickettsiales bacterium]|nr:hypothetical protein [Rickettsiales bacterium]
MNQTTEHNAYDPHDVDHGSPYYKMGWSAYKGHTRGIIRGLVVGCVIGAVIGAGLFGLGAIGLVGVTASLSVLMAGFSAFAGLMAAGLMGRLGNAAGNAASQLAELELRERYPELPEITPDSPAPGYGHHYEVPADRDKGKLFHGRVGLTGGLLGATLGGLAGHAGLAGLMTLHIGGLAAAAPIAAPIILGVIMGSSFGINRSYFKSVFNVTDRLLQGKLSSPSEAELAKDRERYRVAGEDGPAPVITSLQRQEEFYRLENGYYQKAFEAGFAGNARGLVGGIVSGGLLGAVLGGVAVFALSATGIGAVAIFAGVMAFSMHHSSDFFSEAFSEAGGHGHVHELFHERMRGMRKGVELSFDEAEHNIVTRRQADPELTPPDAQERAVFKPRVALIMGALGAVAGLALAPLAGGVAGLLSLGAAHHLTLGLGAATFGLVGASFGIGPKSTEVLHQFGDGIYHGAFSPGSNHPEIKTQGNIPLMSPRSDLAKHYLEHAGAEPSQDGPVHDEHFAQEQSQSTYEYLPNHTHLPDSELTARERPVQELPPQGQQAPQEQGTRPEEAAHCEIVPQEQAQQERVEQQPIAARESTECEVPKEETACSVDHILGRGSRSLKQQITDQEEVTAAQGNHRQ